MTTQSDSPRSRRALLTAGLAAGVATVASTVGRPLAAQAATGDTMVIGAENFAGSVTGLYTGSDSGIVIQTSGAGAVDGVYGLTLGQSDAIANGVHGASYSTKGRGVYGEAGHSTGKTTGVYGFAASPDGVGVHGLTQLGAGVGVMGTSLSNAGVYGESGNSNGVSGSSVSGAGVYATTTGAGSALQVAGKAKFSRSGRATIAANRSYVDITVAGGLTSHSVIHATLQTYRSGVSIAAVRTNYPSAGKARIYLTKVASTTAITYVGWFVAEY